MTTEAEWHPPASAGMERRAHAAVCLRGDTSSLLNAAQSTVFSTAFCFFKTPNQESTRGRPRLSFFSPGKLFRPAPSVPAIHHV